MNVHVLYVLGSLLSPDHSFERLRGAIVTLMNQLFIMRFNFDPWARTQYHSTNDNYTQCLIRTIARSFWILEFAFIALAVCKCSSIWEALVQGKKYNPNFQNFSMEIHGPRSQKVAGNACPWCWRRSDGVLPTMGSLVSTIFQGWVYFGWLIIN